MEKVLNINLNGTTFLIEEPAYLILQVYLESIKKHFSSYDDSDEIMRDIETRIAEMLLARSAGSKTPVLATDIESIMQIIGSPADFAANESDQAEPSNKQNQSDSQSFKQDPLRSKRMFRDDDNKVISGVAMGIANYFGVDPVWIRLAFVATIFFGGFGVLLYIVLMIVLPKAKTIADRMEMKGEPVNLQNIEDFLKKNFNLKPENGEETTLTKILLFPFRLVVQIYEGLVALIGPIFGSLGGFMRWIFGLFMIFVSFVIIFALSIAVLVSLGIIYHKDLAFMNLASPGVQISGLISSYFVIILPAVLIIILGLSLIRKKLIMSVTLAISLGMTWLLALVVCTFSLISILPQFQEEGSVDQKFTHEVGNTNTFYLKTNDLGQHTYFNTHLDIKPWQGEHIELSLRKSSRGKSISDAISNAEKITYQVEFRDSLIIFDSNMGFSKAASFRNQKIDMLLKIPYGTQLRLHPDLINLVDDFENDPGLEEKALAEYIWRSDFNLFTCIDCPEDIVKLASADLKKVKRKLRNMKKLIRKHRSRLKKKFKNEFQREEMQNKLDQISDRINELIDAIDDNKSLYLNDLVSKIQAELNESFDLLEEEDLLDSEIESIQLMLTTKKIFGSDSTVEGKNDSLIIKIK